MQNLSNPWYVYGLPVVSTIVYLLAYPWIMGYANQYRNYVNLQSAKRTRDTEMEIARLKIEQTKALELQEASQEIQEKQKEVDEARARSDNLGAELTQLRLREAKVESEKVHVEGQMEQFKADKEALETGLARATKEFGTPEKDIKNLHQLIIQMDERVGKHQQEIQKYLNDIEAKDSELKSARAELEKTEIMRAKELDVVLTTARERDLLRDKLQDLEENNPLQADLDSQKTLLQQILQAFLHSVSPKEDRFGVEQLVSGLKDLQAEKFTYAIGHFDKAIEQRGDSPDAYFFRGTAYEELRELDQAMADYSRADGIDQNYPDLKRRIKALYDRITIESTRKS